MKRAIRKGFVAGFQRLLLLSGILFTLCLAVALAERTEKYDATSHQVCENGVCTKTIYSGTQFVFEDEQWKSIENARSLKKHFNVIIREDSDFPIEIIDFNYTAVKYKAKIGKNKLRNKNINFRVLDKGDDKVKFNKFHRLRNRFQSTEDVIHLDRHGYNIKNAKLKWGTNSTTIELQDPNSEVLDDSYIRSDSAGNNYGGDTYGYNLDRSARTRNSLFKFDHGLTSNEVILDAYLQINIPTNNLDSASEGYDVSAHHLYNSYIWDEDTVKWNNKPESGTDYNPVADSTITFFGGSGEPKGFQSWDVTNAVSQTTTDGIVSIYLATDNYFGSPYTSDYIRFFTKDASTSTTNKPLLSITFTAGGPSDSCSCPTSGNWDIQSSDNCVISTTCDMQGNDVIVHPGAVGEGVSVTELIDNVGNVFVHGNANVFCYKFEGCFG